MKDSDLMLKYIEQINGHRIEAIYNTSHRYIKEIIWDDDKNLEYGDTRKGYDRYKRETQGYDMSYGGVTSLRTETDRDGNIIGYMTETKKQVNEPLLEIAKIWEESKKGFFEILEINDPEPVEFWISDKIEINYRCPNSIRSAVYELKDMIDEYFFDESFKKFIDKLGKK